MAFHGSSRHSDGLPLGCQSGSEAAWVLPLAVAAQRPEQAKNAAAARQAQARRRQSAGSKSSATMHRRRAFPMPCNPHASHKLTNSHPLLCILCTAATKTTLPPCLLFCPGEAGHSRRSPGSPRHLNCAQRWTQSLSPCRCPGTGTMSGQVHARRPAGGTTGACSRIAAGCRCATSSRGWELVSLCDT